MLSTEILLHHHGLEIAPSSKAVKMAINQILKEYMASLSLEPTGPGRVWVDHH